MIDRQFYIHEMEDVLFKEISESIPFKEEIISQYVNFDEKIRKPDLLGKTVMVTNKQFKNVYDKINKLSDLYEIQTPSCYVYEDFYYGVESKGINETWIEISAKTLTDFNENELMFLLGKEICNIKLNHTQTYTLINEFLNAASNGNIIGSDTYSKAMKVRLNTWYRISCYSSDCFGYLMSESLRDSISAVLKLVLNSSYLVKNMDLREYIQQAEAINELDDSVYNFTKVDEQIPYAPFRIKNLLSYVSSERFYKLTTR